VTGTPSEAAAWDLRQAGTAVPVPPSHHDRDPERWPLRDSITLGALEGAVPSARAHVRQVLWEWGRNENELGQDVGLVVSELVGNAVMASTQLRPAIARVVVWLGSDTRCVLVAVADASPQPPMRLNQRLDAERGRGLALVEAFSSRWGWYPIKAAGTVKVVWAEWATNGINR
jgi:anti-sigma regulatory factor (Ser/Thr protein kinase)